MSKPKEFWIVSYLEELSVADRKPEHADAIHVIEYSAYEKLVSDYNVLNIDGGRALAQNEKFASAIEAMRTALNHYAEAFENDLEFDPICAKDTLSIVDRILK